MMYVFQRYHPSFFHILWTFSVLYDKDNSQVSHHSGKIMAEPVRAKPLFSQNGVIYEAIIRFNAHLTPSIQ